MSPLVSALFPFLASYSLRAKQRTTSIADVMLELESSKRRIAGEPPASWINFTKYLKERVEGYLSDNVRSTYLLCLALKEYEAKKGKRAETRGDI